MDDLGQLDRPKITLRLELGEDTAVETVEFASHRALLRWVAM